MDIKKKREILLQARLDAVFNAGLRASRNPDISYKQFQSVKKQALSTIKQIINAEVIARANQGKNVAVQSNASD